jgi:general secretion pathway protein N
MMDWAKRNPLAALLALAVALLVAAIAAEAFLESHISGPGPAASARKPPPAQAKLLPPLTVATAEQEYPETAARPLFIPTRRPAPVAEGAGQQRFQKGQFSLAGVISAGSLRIAMLKEKTNGHIHRVELGKDVNGIIVERIEPEEVTLAQGGDREVLSLAVQKGPPAGPHTPHASGPFVPAPEVNPAGAPPAAGFPVPGQPFVPPGVAPGTQPGNPLARSAPNPPAGQLTPEELLARRRARRAIPAQPQQQQQ